jgi:glyoxylase I family protein
MMNGISTQGIHHLTLTVTDRDRARDFYTRLLGFEEVMEFGPKLVLSNGTQILSLHLPPDPRQAPRDDQFNESRVGLDHLSFMVENRRDLERAARLFDEQGVPRGEIKDLGPDLPIYVLAFRDPDNIQLELTAPHS